MQNKILVIDNDYSRISGSTRFIHQKLDNNFKYDLIWDQKWTQSKSYQTNILKEYETIIFIHSFLPLNKIYKFKNKNLIWIPMYDSLYNLNQLNNYFWNLIKKLNIKIISFSSIVTNKCLQHNINFFEVNYYLETKILTDQKNKLKILFWDRGEIKFDQWIKFFEKKDIEKITIINRPDPGKKISKISENDKILYNVNFLNIGYIERTIYLKYLEEHDVYICPRFREGIGISYLEALSYSMYILANQMPTMSDYISNQNIGLFLNNDSKIKITTDLVKNTKKFRYENNTKNFEICKKQLEKLNLFIISQHLKKKNSIFFPSSIFFYEICYRSFFLIKRLLIKTKILKN